MMRATVPKLPDHFREIFLDLTLTWGSIDVSLGYFATIFVDEESFFDAVDYLDKKNASAKLHEVIKLLKSAPETPAILEGVRNLRKHKRSLEKHSRTRNHLAHSKCICLDPKDETSVNFLKLERVEDERLAHYSVPFEEFERALAWGRKFDAFLAAAVLATKQDTVEIARV